MRVITGSAKGRKLKMPKGGKTRPAMDMVKGATFNIIAQFVSGARFLDLFAGSGNLGIEALSRGASFAAFVDSSYECVKTIKENLQLTKLEDKAQVYCMDCLKYLRVQKTDPFDVVFIDPPYLKGLLQPMLEFIPLCPMFNSETIFIIERQKRDELEFTTHPQLDLRDERFFGDTVLTFFKLKIT